MSKDKGKEYNEVEALEECLEMLQSGASVEECLSIYPEGGEELRKLLLTATYLADTYNGMPTSVPKAQVWEELRPKLAPKRPGGFLSSRWRWAFATVGIVVVALASVTGVSASSLPGEALYSVKLAVEEVRMALTFTDAGKIELGSVLANKRIDEMAALAAKGDKSGLEMASARLSEHLELMIEAAGMLESSATVVPGPGEGGQTRSAALTSAQTITVPGPTEGNMPANVVALDSGLAPVLEEYAASGSKALKEAIAMAPEDVAPILGESLAQFEISYERLLSALGD